MPFYIFKHNILPTPAAVVENLKLKLILTICSTVLTIRINNQPAWTLYKKLACPYYNKVTGNLQAFNVLVTLFLTTTKALLSLIPLQINDFGYKVWWKFIQQSLTSFCKLNIVNEFLYSIYLQNFSLGLFIFIFSTTRLIL